MGSKERVRKAIHLEHPDHVPLGMYAIDCDTVERIIGRKTYFRDKVRSQIALWEGRREEVAESLKADAVELFEKLDCVDLISFKDAMLLPPRDYEPLRPKKIADDMWEDREGNVYKASYLTNDMTLVRRANSTFREYTAEEFSDEPEVTPPDPSAFEVYDYVMERLGSTRYVAGRAGSIVGMVLLGGMENGLMHYVVDPDAVRASTARAVKIANRMDDFYIHDTDDGILMEQDQATTQGPMISPEMYRSIVLPAMKERITHVKSYGKQILFHCCGNTWKLLDMFVEAGVQCYQSLQTGCMDIRRLKEGYGDRLCFWGGVAVEKLVTGTPEDVRTDVRYALQYGAPGGGFILGPSHSIAYGTQYDNFMAMLDEHDRLKNRV